MKLTMFLVQDMGALQEQIGHLPVVSDMVKILLKVSIGLKLVHWWTYPTITV